MTICGKRCEFSNKPFISNIQLLISHRIHIFRHSCSTFFLDSCNIHYICLILLFESNKSCYESMSAIKKPQYKESADADKELLLMKRISVGDERAFQQLFDIYYPQVRGFVLSFVKNFDDTEDIVQSVFIKLWQKRDRLADVINPNAYLFRMGRNAIMNFLANKKYVVQPLSVGFNKDDSSLDATPQDLLEMQDTKLLIDMVVCNMPTQRRQVYEMSRNEGLSNEEIAKRMNLTKKTIENHLNLALKELRKVLKCLFLLMSWV